MSACALNQVAQSQFLPVRVGSICLAGFLQGLVAWRSYVAVAIGQTWAEYNWQKYGSVCCIYMSKCRRTLPTQKDVVPPVGKVQRWWCGVAFYLRTGLWVLLSGEDALDPQNFADMSIKPWRKLLPVIRKQSRGGARSHNLMSDKCSGYGFGGDRPNRVRLEGFREAIRTSQKCKTMSFTYMLPQIMNYTNNSVIYRYKFLTVNIYTKLLYLIY